MQYDLKELLHFISNYMIFGFIPLDKLLHHLFGAITTILCLHYKNSLKLAFVILLLLGGIKEYYDSFVLQSTMREHILDTLATLSFPFMVLLVRFIKKFTSK